MKKKRESRHPRRIPNRINQKTEIKREIEHCNREFKEETEKISIRPIRLQFFFLFSCFPFNYGNVLNGYNNFIYCFITNYELNLIMAE